jgi:hypothetical protein
MGERGRCFRLISTSPTDRRPMLCPQLLTRVGWRLYEGRWLVLDACEVHYRSNSTSGSTRSRPVRIATRSSPGNGSSCLIMVSGMSRSRSTEPYRVD